MRIFILMVIYAVTVSSFFCGKANAEDHIHDGLFIRLAPGFGIMSASEKMGANRRDLSGISKLVNFAAGGAVAENIILHFDATGVITSNPSVGNTSMTSGGLTTYLVGVGATAYVFSNFYLTGTIGIARTRFESNGKPYETDNGYGVNFMIGKEWWVSENWGLGVAGQLIRTSCPDIAVSGARFNFNTTSIGALISATYN